MPVSEDLKKLVAEMPDPDGRGMYCTNINKEKIETAVVAIQKGGRESVLGLIDMLVPQGQGDGKAHYALHCVGNRTLINKDEAGRKEFSQTLAEQLSADRTKEVKAYLCQELQWAGHSEAAPALGKLLNDEELSAAAAMALVGICEGAAEQLRAALPNAGHLRAEHRSGPGRRGRYASVPALRTALSDKDREVRLAAGWGLSRMGDAGSAEALMKAADAEPGWERIQATKHCLVLAEKLTAAGKKEDAKGIYDSLRKTRTDPSEAYIVEGIDSA